MDHKEKLFGRIDYHIHCAKNLPNMDMFSLTDPFVTVEIDGEELGRTKIIDDQLNPVWDKHGSFNINQELDEIRFMVYDKDPVGSEFIGSVTVPVQELGGGNKVEGLCVLKGTNQDAPGKLKLSVQYFEGETMLMKGAMTMITGIMNP